MIRNVFSESFPRETLTPIKEHYISQLFQVTGWKGMHIKWIAAKVLSYYFKLDLTRKRFIRLLYKSTRTTKWLQYFIKTFVKCFLTVLLVCCNF